MQPLIAHIQMPEGNVLHCQMPEGADEGAFTLGDCCLCEPDYGQDAGRLVKVEPLQPHAGVPSFRVLRKLAPEDAAAIEANAELAQKAKQAFVLSVRYEKTPVKVLHTRFSFGRERLFIRYSAAVAVDLRRFVSQIQRDYKTQVDLWQVSVRHEASLVGCIGVCGREACCCAWQRQFPNVGTRMAKAQDVALNPVTANGRCGRIKCCFAFEFEQYCKMGQDLPEAGSTVRCLSEGEDGTGVVIERNVMCGRMTVRTQGGRILKVLNDKVAVIHAARPVNQTREDNHEDSIGEWSEP
ncbi:MAG: hypothetical protein FWG50_09515 [Kiritimatiellaeota bacterium]|nr:hypothetical protein [Kiritimatiellota bacterium]